VTKGIGFGLSRLSTVPGAEVRADAMRRSTPTSKNIMVTTIIVLIFLAFNTTPKFYLII
jgi:hypothetical protein